MTTKRKPMELCTQCTNELKQTGITLHQEKPKLSHCTHCGYLTATKKTKLT